jgi:hypothetical protein
MKVFLSYASKDEFLANRITAALLKNGLDVWNAETEILPGDNFAEKISDALKDSDAMVALISPESLKSKYVQWEIEYALGDKSYSNRVIPVLVGSEESLSAERIPWILRRLQMIRVAKPEQADKEINQITEALKLAA